MDKNVLKILGIATTLIGAVATLAGELCREKQQETKIEESVQKEVEKQLSDYYASLEVES